MSLIAVALGGNSLLEGGEGTITEQRETIRKTVPQIVSLYERGHDLVFTHGNGPQVGQLLLQNEQATDTPSKPLDVLVAESQAQIGYLLQQELANHLEEQPVTLVTQTRVDADDTAFEEPTKPVGPFYEEDTDRGFPTTEVTRADGSRAYRRVVPSPHPVEIVESDRIESLVDTGKPVICVGGGGIPVVEKDGKLEGVEAVVDKDRATQTLASEIEADELLLLTDVDSAYRNFGTEKQERIAELSPDSARELLADGEFGEGSMAPKIQACAEFVSQGGDRAIITSIENATESLTGDAGTTVTR